MSPAWPPPRLCRAAAAAAPPCAAGLPPLPPSPGEPCGWRGAGRAALGEKGAEGAAAGRASRPVGNAFGYVESAGRCSRGAGGTPYEDGALVAARGQSSSFCLIRSPGVQAVGVRGGWGVLAWARSVTAADHCPDSSACTSRLPRYSLSPPTFPLPPCAAAPPRCLSPPRCRPSARLQVSPVLDDPLARRAVGPKKISKAAQSQESMTFQDAWAAKNGRVLDVWAVIGVLFIIVPPAVIFWALSTGVIPGLV